MRDDIPPEEVEQLSQEPLEERIAIAGKRIELLNLEIAARQREIGAKQDILKGWTEYLELLRQVQKVEGHLRVTPSNGHARVAQQVKQLRSITELLVFFAFQQPRTQITGLAALSWALGQELYITRKAAQQGVNGIMAHRKDLFRRVGRGRYVLTPKGTELGKRLSPEVHPAASAPELQSA